jgi:pimeloyl-ACP methyl ester carboxylesterase
MALQGLATIGINGVGHGFGSRGLLTVTSRNGVFRLPAGGRGIDQDGNGTIDATEGLFASGQVLVNRTDGDRQTAIDLIHLVRAIEVGVDVDGDHVAGLNASRIFSFGNSMGGFVGTLLLATEPAVQAGGIAAVGTSYITIARFTADRALIRAVLAAHQPPLLNALDGPASLLGFDENIPPRDQPPLVNTVPGAMEIQELFERIEWADGAADPGAFAPHIRQRPLRGMPGKDVIVQFAKGDKTVPNPMTSAYLRAGNLKDRATYYRYDLVYPTFDAAEMAGRTGLTVTERNRAKNPHVFLSNLTNPPADRAPKSAAIAFANRDRALDQLAIFFANDGTVTIDPDGPDSAVFETPIAGPLPEVVDGIP